MLAFHQTGFSFVYMDDERDAEDAIRGLDNVEFGRQHRRLRVEWAKVHEHTYVFHYVISLLYDKVTPYVSTTTSDFYNNFVHVFYINNLIKFQIQWMMDFLTTCICKMQQGDGAIRRREDARRSNTKLRPTKTLFVVNFDPINTRVRDLERHFEPYGKLERVQIRKNFGFVQYETQDDATKALEYTNMR